MPVSDRISWLGLGVVAFGVFMLTIAIPYGVSAPSNIQVLVLSPKFWPTIVAGIIILLGAILLVQQWASGGADDDLADDDEDGPIEESASAPWLRLLLMAILMVALIWLTPIIGMVWAAMLTFAAFALIVRTPRRLQSAVVAVLLPLALYLFFAHVAGVAIPQGEFVRLP